MPCVYLPGPAPAVTVANKNNCDLFTNPLCTPTLKYNMKGGVLLHFGHFLKVSILWFKGGKKSHTLIYFFAT